MAAHENNVLLHSNNIPARQKATQERIFRLAQRDHGLTLKAISMDSGIGYTTIQSYARGEAVMSITSLFSLVGVIPDDLLSLLLPEGRRIVRAPEELNHDDIADAMRDYLAAKDHAHHPDSPAGRDIAECEDQSLRAKFTVVQGRAA